MSEDFNMSMRKFLKQVGVTSQKAIEDALRDVENGEFEVQAEISIASLGMVHKVNGTIKRGEDQIEPNKRAGFRGLKKYIT